MSEHLKFLGRRQELEQKKLSLKIQIEGLVKNLRDALDPFEAIENLRVDAIAEWSFELAGAYDGYRAILEELRKIKEILGR